MAVLLEHDHGSEEQYYFRRRIQAYIVILRSEGYKELFQAKGITVPLPLSQARSAVNGCVNGHGKN